MTNKTYHLSCDCGLVAAQIDVRQHLFACCYCADCQRYAQYLKPKNSVLNTEGGTSVMIINPHQLKMIQGHAQLGFLSLSQHGTWRCFATCCHAPILNMSANVKGLHLAVLDYGFSAELRQVMQQHPVLNVRKPEQKFSIATCVTWLRFALGYSYTLTMAWLKKSHLKNPLIDRARGLPIATVRVIDKHL